ncbi:hypothetical protein EGW08_001701, partial [Elysia chlorotica]
PLHRRGPGLLAGRGLRVAADVPVSALPALVRCGCVAAHQQRVRHTVHAHLHLQQNSLQSSKVSRRRDQTRPTARRVPNVHVVRVADRRLHRGLRADLLQGLLAGPALPALHQGQGRGGRHQGLQHGGASRPRATEADIYRHPALCLCCLDRELLQQQY